MALLLALGLALSPQALGAPAAAGGSKDAGSPARPARRVVPDGPFKPETVVALARSLSRSPFVPPAPTTPESLTKLTYDQYRDIRFRSSETLWAHPSHTFQLQVLPVGYLFTTSVDISIVKNGQAQRLAYRPDLFTAGKLVPTPLPTEDIGFSGFRLLHPVNTRRHYDEVAVFQGATYFRAVGRNQQYGLSARGLAVKLGEPSGEEFPAFRAFWIEEPAPRSASVTVHALLDSPSVTGAYRFVIDPGQDTVMQVEAVLFPRVELASVGLGPGTSMYLFSASERSWVDDFRPQVHDSDGLLILNGRGEQLWRPLANPARLQLSAFADQGPRGFGLVQRDRDAAHYQDFESHFERRPSLWVEPTGDWGEGSVVLTEIPTDAEIHDNVVAFWRPRKPLAAGSEFRFAYKLSWGEEPAAAKERLRVVRTALGRADVGGPTPIRRVVIDYAPQRRPCGERCAVPKAAVTASAGKIQDLVVSDNPLTRGYRVTFILDPAKAEASELRLELKFEDSREAEVWLYRWTKR